MREAFISKNFKPASIDIINHANTIIAEYQAQGFDLTLRQLYYQFVARDLIPNTQRSYKNLGNIISDARLTGLIDWDAIVDRTRELERNAHWPSGSSILQSCVRSFMVDRWANQPYRPEVWIEKEALIGVIEDVCEELDVPYFACRGYNSQSEQYKAGKRFEKYAYDGQTPIVFHLGDHDPSGIDMTRDNSERLWMFADGNFSDMNRIALNRDQIDQYDPPPNPTKLSDSRAGPYVRVHGYDSWELDALEPSVIVELIRSNIEPLIDQDLLDERLEYEKHVKDKLHEFTQEMEEDEDD